MRPGFSVKRAYRLEDLRDALLESLQRDPSPPLQPETIVVGSPGMGQWLSLQLARRQGIAASVEFPFPGEWARSLARRMGVEPARGDGPDPFASSVLTLRIHELLPSLAKDREATALAAYLAGDDGRRRQSLSQQLAIHFGEAQLFRPEVLRSWQAGSGGQVEGFDHERWQAPLWRELCERATPALPLSEILLELVEALRAETRPAGLPQRVTVFGLSTLPPPLLRVLQHLGAHVPVDLYFPDPTTEYWADLQTDRVRERQRQREGEPSLGPYADEFHPLLANLGEQGREFFHFLADMDPDGNAIENLESSLPSPATVLGRVQADIVGNRRPRPGDAERSPRADHSILVHDCHSPRRELEVLHDTLLRAFEKDPELQPSDVLVLVPDMLRYGPFVQAVFGARPAGTPRIPFTLADRSWEETDPLVRGLLHLLELAAGRRSSLEVLDLLDMPAVAARFGFDPVSVETARAWVRDAGIRWGADPDQRAQEWQIPAYEGVSWTEGLDQLLLGALVGEVDAPVATVLPATGVPAASLELVGRLSHFARTLFSVLESLSGEHDLPTWSARLAAAVDRLFETETEAQLDTRRQLRRVFSSLEDAASTFELKSRWSRSAVLALLRERLDTPPRPAGFLGGAVTFAALRPLRSLPFEFLALLGLDDGVFPRIDRRDSLDLLAAGRRRGDRSPRRDDRYLFLESLLCARRQLHLSYVGRSERDGSVRAPSVVVSELLDVLQLTFGSDPSEFCVRHRLQGFHPDYFDGSDDRHFSFDAEAAAAARQQRGRVRSVDPFAGEDPSGPDPAPDEIQLDDLLAFWRNPARWFCRRRLSMYLYDEEDAAEEETFSTGGLTGWTLRRALLDGDPDHVDLRPVTRERIRMQLGLPRSPVTEAVLELELTSVRTQRQYQATSRSLEPVAVERRLGERILRGVVDGRTESGLLRLEPGNFHLRHGLDVLLRRAALVGDADAAGPARVVAIDQERTYVAEGYEDDLEQLLTVAVEVFVEAHRRPVYLHDDLAEQVLAALGAEGDPTDAAAIRRALSSTEAGKVLDDEYRGMGLLRDEPWRLLLRGRDPIEVFGADLRRWLAPVYGRVHAWPEGEVGAP